MIQTGATPADVLSAERSLRRAIEDGQLEVFYQPKLELVTGRLSSAEALVRWRHPVRGMVPPGEFIGLAEETGLIADIGEFDQQILSTGTAALEFVARKQDEFAAITKAVQALVGKKKQQAA